MCAQIHGLLVWSHCWSIKCDGKQPHWCCQDQSSEWSQQKLFIMCQGDFDQRRSQRFLQRMLAKTEQSHHWSCSCICHLWLCGQSYQQGDKKINIWIRWDGSLTIWLACCIQNPSLTYSAYVSHHHHHHVHCWLLYQ